jgi:hypothetical protein
MEQEPGDPSPRGSHHGERAPPAYARPASQVQELVTVLAAQGMMGEPMKTVRATGEAIDAPRHWAANGRGHDATGRNLTAVP